ncbi:MAG TPA: tRNA (N(6)-L-threonylcarbamoyladenosine(37)-C(2))-methylthiotransferase MtaB [Planctomycetaceae bacterium]|nr:tRNA (N(6)-L-threonylcarbamoyladenosine(37)-C(2))-methylthiotransferase MtaB [Planctomycetaceae bacterium]
MPTLKTVTLGCKVNQYETQYAREGLARLGYRDAADGETADLCLVNTCTVTAEADRKSRKLIRQLARENPGTRIVVMGCYATRKPEEAASLPGVVDVVTDKRDLPDWLVRFGLAEAPAGITFFGERSRAYVKIQDGCRMNCAYCIIPKTRPVLQSRPIDEVVGEIGSLVERGYREIVLTGIHLGHYGVDLDGVDLDDATDTAGTTNLARLLRRLAVLDGEFRVRLSSIEAAEVTDEVLDAMAEHPARICPHLHVSMQSGSDAVLRRMRRRWTGGELLDHCRKIQQRLDQPALTTDVIVGFPGETEADFEATCRAVEEVGFAKIHVFRFSPRPGTAAAEMGDRVPADVQRERAARLAQIESRLRTAYFESLLGRDLEVLVEGTAGDRSGTLVGTSARYVPVELAGPTEWIGRLVCVKAEKVVEGGIWGKSVDE